MTKLLVLFSSKINKSERSYIILYRKNIELFLALRPLMSVLWRNLICWTSVESRFKLYDRNCFSKHWLLSELIQSLYKCDVSIVLNY